MTNPLPPCLICAGETYTHTPVLWQGLINEWALSPAEADYVDRQQGTRCSGCGCNLRSIALAGAILNAAGTDTRFDEWLATSPPLRTLEINPAGDISPMLAALPRLVRVRYPSIDMQALPHPDGSFDLVLHSDTLEHVPDPRLGLSECQRVLAPGGWLAMTVPTIPGRLTRCRQGLAPSYHGSEGQNRDDHLVHTEFGADTWSMLAEVGFERIGIRTFAYPCAIAWLACKRP
ncbi:MAG: SAM-dependent methyltransferase [Planctomycetota bacterium]|nr:MAG: SAM-dependent methyltransferase [Planctomycetota bacterium]